jgi:hypothetical protein
MMCRGWINNNHSQDVEYFKDGGVVIFWRDFGGCFSWFFFGGAQEQAAGNDR